MVAQLSSSLGLFAVVWLVLCAVSSVVVTDAMLRSQETGYNPGEEAALRDETSPRTGS